MLQFFQQRSLHKAAIASLVIFLTGAQLQVSAVEEKTSHEAELKSSAQLIHEKHYSEGYKAFKKMADTGCPYSQCVLGLMHKNGVGVKKDPKLAFAYFEKSAQQGFGDAQRWLGVMYLKGEGTKANRAKALEWFEKAARNDVVEAQYKIGHMYRSSPLPDIKARGSEWIAKAEKNGVAKVKDGVSRIPAIPESGYSGSNNSYTNGVTNIAQSWGGYSALAKNLQATQQP